MKRTFYFLRDSITGKFYDGSNCDGFVDFEAAAVYYQRKNAEKRIKQLTSGVYNGSWEWMEKCLTTYDDLHWDNKAKRRRDVKQRKNLLNWGIEIVEIEVSVK